MASVPGTIVLGLDIPADRLAYISAKCGLPAWLPDEFAEAWWPAQDDVVGDAVGRGIVLFGEKRIHDDRLWKISHAAWIETTDMSDDMIVMLVRRACENTVFAFLTTTTVNQVALASYLLSSIDSICTENKDIFIGDCVEGQKIGIPPDVRYDIELALHEAISNAVLHGNLQIDGIKGLSIDALEYFAQNLDARIRDPDFALRRVEISGVLANNSLTIKVVDQGKGFASKAPTVSALEKSASGRGLELIRSIAQSCELLDGGRCIRMRFAL
ncbi:serine/threonine-protein kinase RsbW [Azospirillaceae bacterium]